MANVRYPGTAGTTPGTITASDVTYDNTTSGLTADDVQEAIDEIEGQISGLSYDASDISYDNTTSGLTADDVQEAIDEIEGQIGSLSYNASEISYDNTTSGLTADDVQEALDEIDGNVDTLSGKVYKTDDSTETNIASDDLLPIYDTSATASKKITVANVVKATVSNPNLLDNPWFTVNQRGASTVTAGNYGVDRWLPIRGNYVVNADGSLTYTHETTTGLGYIGQRIEKDFLTPLVGKAVTLSVKLSDNSILSHTFDSLTSAGNYIQIDNNVFCIDLSLANYANVFFGFPANNTGATTFTIKAIKLEVGSVSTLAMDTAPNYATELLKCQRYCIALNPSLSKYAMVATGIGWATTEADFVLSLPTIMRTTPVLVSGSTWVLSDGVNWKAPTSIFAISQGNNYKVLFETTGLTQGKLYLLGTDAAASPLILSADL